MTEDQRFASRRPDVLVYETEPLDRDIMIAGPITPMLKVSTSGTDSDFVGQVDRRLSGRLPRPGHPTRPGSAWAATSSSCAGSRSGASFGKAWKSPSPLSPTRSEKIEFVMPDAYHVFRPGHRIMVQIQSSWFPLTDRNPQKFMDIPKAKEADFVKAVERVYRGGADGSRIRLLVLE